MAESELMQQNVLSQQEDSWKSFRFGKCNIENLETCLEHRIGWRVPSVPCVLGWRVCINPKHLLNKDPEEYGALGTIGANQPWAQVCHLKK